MHCAQSVLTRRCVVAGIRLVTRRQCQYPFYFKLIKPMPFFWTSSINQAHWTTICLAVSWRLLKALLLLPRGPTNTLCINQVWWWTWPGLPFRWGQLAWALDNEPTNSVWAFILWKTMQNRMLPSFFISKTIGLLHSLVDGLMTWYIPIRVNQANLCMFNQWGGSCSLLTTFSLQPIWSDCGCGFELMQWPQLCQISTNKLFEHWCSTVVEHQCYRLI